MDIENKTLKLHDAQRKLEEAKGRYSSLKTLQDSAHGDEGKQVMTWFHAQGINDARRLVELVQLEKGWEIAFEKALSIPASAFIKRNLIEKIKLGYNRISEVPTDITLVDSEEFEVSEKGSRATMLSKIKTAPASIKAMARNILIAESPEEITKLTNELQGNRVAVLKDGTVFGKSWVSIASKESNKSNLILREHAISEISEEAKILEERIKTIQESLVRTNDQVSKLLIDETELEKSLQKREKDVISANEQYLEVKAKSDQINSTIEKIAQDKQKILESLSRTADRELEMKVQQQNNDLQLNQEIEKKKILISTHKQIEKDIEDLRTVLLKERDQIHFLELKYQEYKAKKDSINNSIRQDKELKAELFQRHEKLSLLLTETLDADRGEEQKLEQAFLQKDKAEFNINEIRSEIGVIDQQVKEQNSSRKLLDQEAEEFKIERENLRVEDKSLEVLQTEIVRGANKLEADVKAITDTLSPGETEEMLELEMTKVISKINRLGPLNLAAIEEFSQLEIRKNYLDRQYDDLEKALATLASAIRKIDQETKSRFRRIFDAVNNNLTDTFRDLFGGGTAKLILTEEDLLDAGVMIIARPPGKRNTNIQQLSGGEKALTALSIIFTIFKLKPSPFCLLDEVDAPLDDSNVLRYTQMIKTMANTIQFLFVTHNKLTMEMADQLIGITMQEPGVSRVVAVDVIDAVKLVESV